MSAMSRKWEVEQMNVFRRRELKFLVNEQQRQQLEQVMRQRMVPDKYGRSTICNLYYDTPDYRLIRHSLERPVYKEKLRLRSYGPAKPGVDIFLEMKKKYKGIVYKRRIRVTEEEAQAFMQRQSPLPEDSQIAREMAYFRDFYRELAPRVYLSYEREAWFDPADSGFRMTLDRNIQYRTTDLSLAGPTAGRAILPPDVSLLEVKASGGIPMWLTEHLSQHKIHKQSFSKYGRAYLELLQESIKESRGRTYA
jgi:SPX domain protein involved in polyphosphate accumulation